MATLRHVFVYGTLLAPEILNVLLRRVPASVPALVADFHRFSIKHRVYPAALPFKGKQIEGKVLFDLTEHELAVLDEFEDVDYTKEVVEPILFDDDQAKEALQLRASGLKASIYLWVNSHDKDLYGDWNYEDWRALHLEEYTKLCESFMVEFDKNWPPDEGVAK